MNRRNASRLARDQRYRPLALGCKAGNPPDVIHDYLMEQGLQQMQSLLTVGEQYLIRGIGFAWTGRLKAVDFDWLLLEDAAWIADLGRVNDALRSGEFNEVEPFINDTLVNVSNIQDVTIWPHRLPREQK